MAQIIDVPGVGQVEFPDGMSDADIVGAIKKGGASWGMTKQVPSNWAVAANAANKGLGGVPDAVLNTPNRLWNLGKAAVGTAATALGRPDMAPDLTPDREYASWLLRKAGFIRDEAEPATGGQRLLDAAVQGGVGAALNPASTGKQLASLVGMGGLMGLTGEGTHQATGNDALSITASMLTPSAAATTRRAAAWRPDPANAMRNRLTDALGLQPDQINAMMRTAQQQPRELVDGSKLTLSQALELGGANTPGVKMLERIVAGGPGGDKLLSRYADQNDARMASLVDGGAQVYQGAPKEQATIQGDKIAAVLRTQALDDKAATRQKWEGVNQRATDDGVSLYLPLQELTKAMNPLGRGTVGAGADARAIMREADSIGNVDVPGITATRDNVSARPKTLAQAVREAGGLSLENNEGLRGELKGLKGDLKNLVRTNGGLTPGRMAEKMREAGYLQDEGADTLFQALRADSGGRAQYSVNASPERSWRAQMEASMGDAPVAERVPVPFEDFQRLRRSAGSLGAKVSSREGGDVEGGVLGAMKGIFSKKVDEAAAGEVRPGEVISPAFAAQYEAARNATRQDAERYKGGNNIAQILRKPVGQDYTITGDEVFNKLWHGGGGLLGDVSNLKNVLSQNNSGPVMSALQQAIMTEMAGNVKAGGDLGSGFPKYVENRLPGMQEALTPQQLKIATSVAADIRNAEAAGTVAGLRGSDTQAKIARAMDAGLIDAPTMKLLAKVMTYKGFGLEMIRAKMAEHSMKQKGEAMAGLLADYETLAPRARRGLLGGADSPNLGGLLGTLNSLQPAEQW